MKRNKGDPDTQFRREGGGQSGDPVRDRGGPGPQKGAALLVSGEGLLFLFAGPSSRLPGGARWTEPAGRMGTRSSPGPPLAARQRPESSLDSPGALEESHRDPHDLDRLDRVRDGGWWPRLSIDTFPRSSPHLCWWWATQAPGLGPKEVEKTIHPGAWRSM